MARGLVAAEGRSLPARPRACSLPLLTEGFEATSLPTLVQMVDNGLGTTLLPRLAVDAGLLQGTNLVTRPLLSHEAARKIGLVWRRGTGRRNEFRLLAKELMERAKLKSKSAAHQ